MSIPRRYFGDTSAILKLYHHEIGSAWMEQLFNDQSVNLVISELTTIEVASALARRLRRGEISRRAYQVALDNFARDCTDRFILIPLTSRLAERARSLVDKYGQELAIRTLDAIQLAAGLLMVQEGNELEEWRLVGADAVLLNLGRQEGMLTINPELEEVVLTAEGVSVSH